MRRIFSLLFITALSLFGTLAAQSQDRAILVLDGSGSMWGQIDGEAKITIAQRVIADLLQTLPATTELGLTAYGHREKGNCNDIETLVLPGPDTRAEILAAVNAISPKGKTPLSAAVLAAAQILRYEEERATVILVSDGRETCDFDPCALGNELEASGVDFTAHVVGFDVENDPEAKAQLQCLADNTGGKFLPAANAAELAEALTQISAQPAPEPEPAFFGINANVRIENNGAFITEGLVWWLRDADGTYIVEAENAASLALTLEEGDYVIDLLRIEDELNLEYAFTLAGTQNITLELPEVPLFASLQAPETAVAGSDIQVVWDGPNDKNDYIDIAAAGAEDRTYADYTYTREGTPLTMGTASMAGAYEIRYYSATLRRIIARIPITLTEPTASITAPATANAGEDLVVEWRGPDYQSDYMTVAEIGSDGQDSVNYTYTREGSPLRLTMPANAGNYEIRYVMRQDSRILATHAISVVEISATLSAPETASAGEQLVIEWTGPDYASDHIAIYAANAAFDARYITYTYTREGSPLRLQMPADPGDYEIRYIQNQGKKTLARTPITVTDVGASITAPATGIAGEDMVIQWSGPDYQSDYIAIFDANAAFDARYLTYTYTREGSPLRLQMPIEPGTYEIRYILSQDKSTLATQTVTLSAVTGTLSVPDNADAGSNIVVEWTGPDYQSDYIAVFPDSSDESRYINYTYTRQGSPLRLLLPPEAGTFEVRYILGQDKSALARATITVNPVSAEISAPATGNVGEDVVVEWTGPDNQNDYLGVYPAGSAADARYTGYTYTRSGSPLRLKMPDVPGNYEIRYIMGQGKTVLGSTQITVE